MTNLVSSNLATNIRLARLTTSRAWFALSITAILLVSVILVSTNSAVGVKDTSGTIKDAIGDSGQPSQDDLEMLDRVSELLDDMPNHWPVIPRYEARQDNLVALTALRDCLTASTCGSNQKTVVVVGSWRFGNSKYGGVGGEDIW